MRFSRVFATLAASMVFGVLAAPTQAVATEKDGVLEPGEIGFFHRSTPGLVFELTNADRDFGDDVFPGTATAVVGNIGRLWNRDVRWWQLFTGPDYTGSHACVPPGHAGNVSPSQGGVQSAYPIPASC